MKRSSSQPFFIFIYLFPDQPRLSAREGKPVRSNDVPLGGRHEPQHQHGEYLRVGPHAREGPDACMDSSFIVRGVSGGEREENLVENTDPISTNRAYALASQKWRREETRVKLKTSSRNLLFLIERMDGWQVGPKKLIANKRFEEESVNRLQRLSAL